MSIIGGPPTGGSMEQEVRQVLVDYLRSVERRDLPGFLSFFLGGEHFTVFEDRDSYDWKAFVAFAEGFFSAVSRIGFELERCSVDPVAPEVAIATGVFRGKGQMISGEPLAIRNAFTFVLAKRDSAWRIRHVHESSLQ